MGPRRETATTAAGTASNLTILTHLPKTHLPQASALHSKTFLTDPVVLYFLQDVPEPERTAYFPKYIYTLLKAGALNGAVFDEIWDDGSALNDMSGRSTEESPRVGADGRPLAPSCSAVWLPAGPGSRAIDHWTTLVPAGFVPCTFKLGIKAAFRMLMFPYASKKAKQNGLRLANRPAKYDEVFGSQPEMSRIANGCVDYHYLYFISTADDQRRKGLSSMLIKQYQQRVIEEGKGKPIWLESTTLQSRRVYEKCGFQLVQEWTVGKGLVGKDGLNVKKGESAYKTADGVPIYGMVWWPPVK